MVVVAGVVVVVGAGASKIEIKAYISLSNINTHYTMKKTSKIVLIITAIVARTPAVIFHLSSNTHCSTICKAVF